MIATLLAVLLVTILGYIINTVSKPRKYPPGPKWYPFVGSSAIARKVALQYGSQWKGFSHLAKEYSTEVLGLKLGSELVVVVFGEKNLRKVFTEKEYEGRPDSFFIRQRCLGKRLGITFVDGPLWREHRQFTVKNLKNVGFGKTAMETEIQTELHNILEYIEKSKTKAINPKVILAQSVMNILWKYTAGERIKEDQLQYVIDLFSKRSKAFTIAGGWLNQWPWLRFIFPKLSGYTIIKNLNQQISDIIDETVNKHKNGLVPGSDFIYSFLEEMKENNVSFHEEQLKAICLDILIAGAQTTSNVLEFAILSLIRHKQIQEKVYDEIHSVIGEDTPCWNDSNRLLYTMAFLLEVQRFYTIAPLAGPRRVLEETTIEDYVLPKNTTVLLSIGDVHFSPDLWDEPNKFNPDRFLDSSGKLVNTEHFYGFGLGRRRCPGDSLAKSFIFIVLVGIVQKYRIESENGVLPAEEPIIGLISGARPFSAEFIPRF
ncbi:probable cytochrome P450 305a1 [Colias croceus]|uniref:probable cytochrome P450 305a1 n=1 Tax=Colias crocea TaxID=72248 RepID=UPI001E27EC83|nr:probable cytochrome P450 305a1 [Colias croceus]